jgi:signal transduction histidine kinase
VVPAVFDRVIAKLRNFRHLRLKRASLVIACVILVCIVGYADYVTAYDRPMLLFYLLPISVAAWFGGFGFSLAIAIASVGAWRLSDVAAGNPFEGWWNLVMAFAAFVVFAGVLSKLSTLVHELDRRVDERTAELKREMAERQRLDREIAQVADRERRRLGHDLHDKLGQHLIGTALAAQAIKEKLYKRSAPEAADVGNLARHLDEGVDLTRKLARGFYSPELDAEGLPEALRYLADSITERSQVKCVFHGENSIQIQDSTIANQLYRIAQEAVTNSVKHAAANNIEVRLAMDDNEVCLAIVDDGIGFPDRRESNGIGLRLMHHGAELIGAKFNIRRNGEKGTIVTCRATHLQSQTAR